MNTGPVTRMFDPGPDFGPDFGFDQDAGAEEYGTCHPNVDRTLADGQNMIFALLAD